MLELATKKIIKKYHPKVVAILSAEGKSGVKEALDAVLGKKFSVRAGRTIENTGSVYGEILGIDRSEFSSAFLFKVMPWLVFKKDFPEIIVLEFAASGKDIIKKLAAIGIDFDFLVIDSIAGNGGKLADLRNLIKGIGGKTKIILNKDDKTLAKLNGDLKNLASYSMEKSTADVYALALSQGANKWLMCNGKTGLSFKICVGANTVPVRMEKVAGKEYISSAVAAYPVGLALGLNLVEISESLQNYKGIPGKMNLRAGIKNTLIIDQTKDTSCDYIKEAVALFKKIENRRKIAVLGDLLDLGKDAETYHRKIGKSVVSSGAEIIIAIGERSVFVKDEAIKAGLSESNIHVFSANEIQKAGIFLQDLMKENDVILVSGSEELHMEKIIKEIKV